MTTTDRPDEQVRVVLVGCGAMGERVARAVYARPGRHHYELVAVVDGRADRAGAVADALGVPAYASMAEAASSTAIDAADLRVPHAAHAGVAVEAMGHGWHVLVEKPLATTAAEAARILEAAAAGGRVAAVAENYPHLRAVRAAVAAIAAGRIGQVRAVRTTRAFTLDGVWVRDGWRLGGGPASGLLIDQGTHHVSLLRQLGGEIVAVSAEPSRSAPVGEAPTETLLLTCRFRSGLAAHALYSWGVAALDREQEGTVFGSDGRIDIGVSYDSDHGTALLFDAEHPGGVALSEPEDYYDSHRWIIEDWVEAIVGEREPVVSAAEGQRDLAVVLAAQRSLEHGGVPVEVDRP